MTSQFRLRRIDEDEKLTTQHRTVPERLQHHRQMVWLACATTSLLTSRHLLVERNVHYPLQLYISQIPATAVVALCLHPWRRKYPGTSEQERQTDRSIRGTFMVVVSHCFEALSSYCIVQAVLHTANLPLLCMLITVAFLVEGILLYVVSYVPRSRAETLRLGLLLPACVGTLLMEYRLRVQSLVASLLAMIFFGAASALKKLVAKHYPGDIGRQNTNNCWLVGMGSLVAVAFALGRGTSELTAGFNMGSVPLRTVNALSTAAALLVGGSILCPTEKLWNSQPTAIGHRPTERVRDALIILALTGITGCYSTLSLRRSFTSWYQLCCFLVAVLCVCGKDVYDAIWNRNKHSSDDGGSYDLVSHSSGTRAEDREESGVADRIHRKEYRGYSLRSSLVSVALIMLWTAYISFNFGQRPYPRINTLLDQEYKPAVSLDVVVSMYKERTEDVAALISKLESMPQMSDAHIIIYLKDGKADERRIKEETNAHEVIKLPNVGREAETYLNHIVTRWDRLAERTVFLQADVHNPREFYPFFSRYFDRNRTGFLNLGWAGNVCNTERCGDMFGWEDETSFISQLQSQIYNSTSENVLLSYKGQFVVTAARIRGINKATYEELRQYLTDANSWTHQQEYLQGRPESMSQPYFGYTLERIWNVLFQCSDMNIAWKCPTLLSGWRPGGSIADCQCFDTEPDS